MIIVTIRKDTSSIYSLSANSDMDIKFNRGNKYAVLIPECYSLNNIISLHRLEKSACIAAKKLDKKGYPVTVIDSDGARYEYDSYRGLVDIGADPYDTTTA